jgi:hypothetical protein
VADLPSFSNAELRAIATRNLVTCCDECRALLREQLEREELDLPPRLYQEESI